jgi:hypothetical protein
MYSLYIAKCCNSESLCHKTELSLPKNERQCIFVKFQSGNALPIACPSCCGVHEPEVHTLRKYVQQTLEKQGMQGCPVQKMQACRNELPFVASTH